MKTTTRSAGTDSSLPCEDGVRAAPQCGAGGIKLEKSDRRSRKNRRGAAVVEFAIVAPIFFLLIFGMIEYGRMIMVQQVLTNASREGARLAVLDGIVDDDVQTRVVNYMQGAGITISPDAVAVTQNPPVPPDYADSMTIAVTVPFSQVSWLPSPMYLGGYNLRATTTMRREAVD